MKKVLLFVLIILVLASTSAVLAESSQEGVAFSATDVYRMERVTDELPVTFEATVYFPDDMADTERGGVILGNYGNSTRCISFEIYSGGSPRIYWVDSAGKVRDIAFKAINLYTGEWTHIAIVRDDMKLYCYINGELKQTLPSGTLSEEPCPDVFAVGGDLRSGNAQNFKGRIKSVAIYSDVRTADEIKADMNGTIDSDNLIAGYDFSSVGQSMPDEFANLSGKGNSLKRYVAWMDEAPKTKDYAYSFAVVGDTQVIAEYHPEQFTHIYDWIASNVAEKEIKFVFGMGDITNSDTTAEWTLAKQHISKLDALVPYSLCRGNHDSSAGFTGTFGQSKFADLVQGRYENTLENTWQELVVGETKYLIMTLDYGANDAVLAWAGDVISSHPEHQVIITTHAYLFRDGTTLDQKDVWPPSATGGVNNGDHMWEKLISKHKNIKLVLSGHDPCDRVVVTQTKGVWGNTVTQMLVDPQGVDSAQGPSGLVAMLYFSEDGKQISVEYYATVKKQYYMPENQFTIDLELAEEEEKSVSEVSALVSEQASEPISIAPEENNPLPMILIISGVFVLLAVAAVLVLRKKK
ncbi:MAG: metallophosphoesterase [Oscillospiraceae bacterium]|nr:metallophosphoesterase [Oscillospiraceae bacterium]